MIGSQDGREIPTLADSHYFLLNKDIDSTSTGDAMTFIMERNLLPPSKRPKSIKFLINSSGGEVPSAFALIDIMEASSIPIWTFGLGEIASCALWIFMAGHKSHRFVTPNTGILSHQFSWSVFGKEHELFARAKEFDQLDERIIRHYKKHSGQNETTIKKFLLPANDVWLSAKEALKYGLADQIINKLGDYK